MAVAALKEPIAVLPQYVANAPTTLYVRGHLSGLCSYAFEITTPTQPLFRSDGRFSSHHVVRDAATNTSLLEIHRKALSMLGTYVVEVGGHEVVRAERRLSFGRQKVDVEIPRLGVMFSLKGQDMRRTKVHVYLGDSDVCVMTCRRERWTRGQAWEANVAAGFDLSLASAIVLILAAMHQASRNNSAVAAAGASA